MEKLAQVKNLLEQIKSAQGDGFKYNENAIGEAFEKQESEKSTLSIKLLSAFGGFLAALAFSGFLGIIGIFDTGSGPLIVGVASIIIALVLNRFVDNLLIDTFSVSMYIIGFIGLTFGLLQLNLDESLVAVLVMLVALLGLFVSQNYLLSFIGTLTIACCSMALIFINDSYNLIHLYISFYALLLIFWCLNEAKFLVQNSFLMRLYNPIRIGLVFSLLFGLIVVGKRGLVEVSENYLWISSIVILAAIISLIPRILKVVGMRNPKQKGIVYLLSVVTLLPTLFCPSISGAILIVLLGFYINHKAILVIGIAALVYFVSQYYYDLSFTLLTKSIILITSGLVFIIFYLFTRKTLKEDEKD